MPRAAPRNQAEMREMATRLAEAAAVDSTVAGELRDIWDDAITAMRATIEHGTLEDRLSVVKVLSPIMRELGYTSSTSDSTLRADEKARQILLGNWDDIKGTIRRDE